MLNYRLFSALLLIKINASDNRMLLRVWGVRLMLKLWVLIIELCSLNFF